MSKDLSLKDSSLTNITTNIPSLIDNDIWGLLDFNKELEEVDKLVQKSLKIKKRSFLIISTVGEVIGSSMLLIQFQKWRTKRLKLNILNSLDILLPKVAYIEESIRLWLEAIVMKKWNIRNEVLNILNNINELMNEYKYYLQFYQNKLKEYNDLILLLHNEIQFIDYQLNFIEDVYYMKEVENDLRLRHKNEIQNIFIGEIDYQEAVPSYDSNFSKSRLISRDSTTVFGENDSSAFQFTVTEDELQQEISTRRKKIKNLLNQARKQRNKIQKYHDKLKTKISSLVELKTNLSTKGSVHTLVQSKSSDSNENNETTNKLMSNLINNQNQNENNEIYNDNIDDDNNNQNQSELSLRESTPFLRDIRKVLQEGGAQNSDEESQDLHQHFLLSNILSPKFDNINDLPTMEKAHELYQNLILLAALEEKAKSSLEKAIEQKNELIQLKATLLENDPETPKSKSTLSVSPIYDIIWGMYCVPAPKLSQYDTTTSLPLYYSTDMYFCRSLVKYREFPFQAFGSELLKYNHSNLNKDEISSSSVPTSTTTTTTTSFCLKPENSHISGILNKEYLDLMRVLHLLSESAPTAANTSIQSVYLKEFLVSELEILLSQLRADTLRIHTLNDKYTPTWSQEHPPFNPDTLNLNEDQEERLSNESIKSQENIRPRSISRGRTPSFTQSRARSNSRTRSRSRSKSRARSNSRRESESSLIERLTLSFKNVFESDNDNLQNKNNQQILQLNSPSGCGILWESKALHKNSQYYCESSTGYYAPVGFHGALAIFSRSYRYQDLLTALSLRDMISIEQGIHLPLLVFSAEENLFYGVPSKLQSKILSEFLHECSPHPCSCVDQPCTYPSLPSNAPNIMKLNLPFYSDLTTIQQVRLHGAWSCTHSFLTNIYPLSYPIHAREVSNYIYQGLTEAVYSANDEAANAIIQSAGFALLKLPKFIYHGNSRTRSNTYPADSFNTLNNPEEYTSLKGLKTPTNLSYLDQNIEENINHDSTLPFEQLIQTISKLIEEFQSPKSGPIPQSKLMIPLGIVRIIQATIAKQTSLRLDETCIALSRWIELSSSVAFRVLGSTHTSVAQAQAIGAIHPINVSTNNSNNNSNNNNITKKNNNKNDLNVESKSNSNSSEEEQSERDTSIKDDSSPYNKLSNSKIALQRSKDRRMPLIANVAVSCRVELYHDLLSAQISATSGKACSDNIFASEGEWNNQTQRGSLLHRSSEYTFAPDEQIHLFEILCNFVCSLGQEVGISGKNNNSKSNKSKQSSTNSSTPATATTIQSVRHNIRFHVFQYLLGLDERWNFTQTVSICETALGLIQKYRPLLSDISSYPLDILHYCGPFNFIGKKSNLLTPSTINVIARGIPVTLHGSACSVRYSLLHDGASIMTLLNKSESKSYKACLLVIQDSAGYVFGGFLHGQIKNKEKEYFGTSSCFVFRALPDTKIYTWTKRNEYFFCYSSDFIGMGGGAHGFAFALDEDLNGGTSAISDTFGNSILSFTNVFESSQVELITFE